MCRKYKISQSISDLSLCFSLRSLPYILLYFNLDDSASYCIFMNRWRICACDTGDPACPPFCPHTMYVVIWRGVAMCNSADDMEFVLRKQRRWNTLYKMRQLVWLWFCETEPGLLRISSILIMLYMTFLYGLLQYKLHMGATGMRVISYSHLVDRTCCKYCINLAVRSKQNNPVQEKLRVIFIYLYIKKCYCKYFVKFVNTLHVFFDLNDLQGVFCFDKLWLYSMYKNTKNNKNSAG